MLDSILSEDLILAEDAALPPGPPLLLDSGEPASQYLISRNIPGDGLVSLVEAIFSSRRATDLIGGPTGRDAQTSIDVMNEYVLTLFHLP